MMLFKRKIKERNNKMIKPMYVVRDTLTGYAEPSCLYSDEVAKREFFNAYRKHPNKDYMQIWKVATFDSESGTVVGCIPELLMKGVDIDAKQ